MTTLALAGAPTARPDQFPPVRVPRDLDAVASHAEELHDDVLSLTGHLLAAEALLASLRDDLADACARTDTIADLAVALLAEVGRWPFGHRAAARRRLLDSLGARARHLETAR